MAAYDADADAQAINRDCAGRQAENFLGFDFPFPLFAAVAVPQITVDLGRGCPSMERQAPQWAYRGY